MRLQLRYLLGVQSFEGFMEPEDPLPRELTHIAAGRRP